jgi:hypothetical protein
MEDSLSDVEVDEEDVEVVVDEVDEVDDEVVAIDEDVSVDVELEEVDEDEDEEDDAVASTTRYNPVSVCCSNSRRKHSSQTRCARRGMTYCLRIQLL